MTELQAMATPLTPSTMDNVVGSLHSGGLITLMMQLAHQRSSERRSRPEGDVTFGVEPVMQTDR